MSRGWAHLLEKTLPTGGNESSAFDDSTNSVDNADVGSGLEAAINTAANGTYLINPSALTASKLDTATDTATSGTYSTDPSALTNGKIRSFATSIDPNGVGTRSSGTTSNAASLDTSNTSTPNLSVDASDPAHVTFTVSGLESDYSGGVTFTDSTSKSDVVPISGNGNYSANLSNLTNGTLTYLMTVSNPAGNVINVDPTTTLGDGSANAPAGTPQFPNLLNGYAVRPPWMVAGVDYAVGVPAGTALKDPTTLSGVSGISIDNSAHHVIVSGNNITISNIDFSLDGGWQLIVEGGQNLTVTNSNFAIGSNGNAMFNQVSANNTVFMYDTFNGNGRSDSLNDTVFNLSGGATIEYCLVENSPSDDVDYGYSNTIKYNVFANDGQLAGSHPDWLQLSNGTLTNQTVEYNTFIQTSGFSQGIGLYSGVPGSYSLTTANVSNNTIVTSASDPGVNYVFSTVLNGSKPGGGTGSLTGAASIQNNYIDPSGVNTTVFETVGTLQPGASYIQSNNINMVTGALLPQNVTSVTSVVASPASGVEIPGNTITLTLEMSGPATITGPPTLTLNDGGTATYIGGSGSNALTFSYTVGTSDTPVSGLAITQVNMPNGAKITDGSGNAVVLTNALVTFSGLQIDPPTGPTPTSVLESPASGDLDAGKTVTLTLNMSENVTVNTTSGTPTLTLNDGGTAAFSGGSGSNALTFSYTVGAGQNTVALAATAVNLNSATITDGAGNAANLALSGLTQRGPQIDTITPTITSLAETPSSGDLNAGKTVTFTLNLNEAVTVAGGSPTLTLNDGGTATFSGGSGSNALTFSYTVGAGQNTAALAATAVNLNSATITDGAGNAANLSLSGLTQNGPQIDALTPTVSSLTESPASADLNAGKTVTLTLNLSEAVTVAGGTPTLTLNDGGTATFSGSSASNALTFSYTVGAGQNTAALAATAVNLNSATITDSAGNAANLALSGLTQSGPQIDTITPTITSLAETPSSGDLNAGKVVTVTLGMSEIVTVNTTGGTPTLSLNDGGTAGYTGGSDTNALTFSYTVLQGQNTPDLMETAVNLNGATIADGAGNIANQSLVGVPLGSPQIDTTTPTITSLTESPANADLNVGKTVTLTLDLSEAVTVAGGTPTLTLNDGGAATYSGGSGSNAIIFSYTVGAGQNTTALAATAVNLNQATISDGAGNAANLSLSGLPQSGPQIDTVTPTISSLAESPSSGNLNAGKTVTFTLSLNEAVTVAGGAPTLTLNDGGTATYSGGSGTNALTFSYTVGAGQNTSALAATAVNLDSASITDGAGNAANLSLSGLTQSGPQIDTLTPNISSLVESPSSGDLNAGKTVTFTLNLNEAITVAGGTPTLTLNDGGTATYSGGSRTNALTFSYTVGAGQNTSALAATAVNLNSASITDGAGNAANLSLSGLTQSGPQINTLTPSISSLVESPSSGDLNAGKTVTFTLNLNEAITVAGGTPTLTLNDGGTATYRGGSGTNALTFSYTVDAGQNTSALAATAVNLNSASITDGAGNAANLSLSGQTQSGPQIDTITPSITSLAESPSSGDLNAGKVVTITLGMSEIVAVNTTGGTPTLSLNDGGTATYTGGSGIDALTFSYTVLQGQNTPDLMETAVNLNGATIADGAGNIANLSLVGVPQGSPQIDTTTPSVTSLTESPASGDLNTGKTVTLTLNLSEAVTVAGGTPTLTLNDGGTATYSGGSGTNALTFSYTVGAGQYTTALAATAVNLNSATIIDGAGNAANLSLSGLTQSGPQIDALTPTVSSLVESPATGELNAGNTVTLILNLSEAVTVAGGTPTLTLNNGGTATYTGGSGTDALTFSYTVGAGQSTFSLAATAVNLNSAIITDGAGNAANLSLSGLTQSGPQIDALSLNALTPTVSSLVESPASGDLNAGKTVTLTLNLSEGVTVAGGMPTLTLNDGGTATYTGGSGTNALTFSYTVGVGQNTSALAATAVNLNSATITDGTGNVANLSLSGLTQSGPQIDTTTPVISSIAESPSSGDLNAGKIVTYTLTMSEAVIMTGGTPTLTLNDGGTAIYTGGSGTNALTFSYTVLAGQNTPDLMVTTVNLNSAAIADGAGNGANLSLSGLTQGSPQIHTTAPVISSIAESPSSGDLKAGNNVTFTLNMTEAVTVAGGTPTLTLNDGGTATYTGGSGTNALAFSYTVAARQNTSALAAVAVILNAASITDGAGNAASLSLSGLTQRGPQIDTTPPPPPVIVSDKVIGKRVVLSGTEAQNGAVISVYDGTTLLGTTTTSTKGAWVFQTGALAKGAHVFTATATDLAGNVSGSSAAYDPNVGAGPTITAAPIDAGNKTYIYNSAGFGIALSYAGNGVTDGEFGAWTSIAATQTASGYDVAWQNTATGQFTVWTTDSNGNYTRNLIGTVAGNGYTLESFETVFNQDLNGDGVTGLNPTVIQTDSSSFGSTSLDKIGNNYFLFAAGGTIGPDLRYNGAAVTTSQFGSWMPIGAVQTANGYDVAWQNAANGQYTVWNTDSNGNYTRNLIGAVAGNGYTLESFETVFNQDLNGDGVTGLNPTVIQTDSSSFGSTSLGKIGKNYLLFAAGGTTGPDLKYNGAAVTTGQFGSWMPIGAVQTANGYDVAWQNAATGQYTVWTTNSNGNYTRNLIGAMSGNSYALESFEPAFQQDLDGDGVVGLYTVPGTSLKFSQPLSGASGAATVGVGATLELAAGDSASVTFAASTGMLKLDQPSTFSAEIFGFTGNGALSGSDQIDLKGINYNTVQDSYANGLLTVTDGSGDTAKLNFNGSYTLANFDFASDGGDGTIVFDPPVSPLSPSQNPTASGPSTSCATVGSGATLDLAASDAESVTFTGSIGTLILDGPGSTAQPLNFAGVVSGFGDQDVIDLPGIAFDAHTTLGYLPNSNLTGGTLSLQDGIHSANIALLGNYMASSFATASDNHGGMMVVAEAAALPSDQSVLSNPHHA